MVRTMLAIALLPLAAAAAAAAPAVAVDTSSLVWNSTTPGWEFMQFDIRMTDTGGHAKLGGIGLAVCFSGSGIDQLVYDSTYPNMRKTGSSWRTEVGADWAWQYYFIHPNPPFDQYEIWEKLSTSAMYPLLTTPVGEGYVTFGITNWYASVTPVDNNDIVARIKIRWTGVMPAGPIYVEIINDSGILGSTPNTWAEDPALPGYIGPTVACAVTDLNGPDALGQNGANTHALLYIPEPGALALLGLGLLGLAARRKLGQVATAG